MLPFSYSFLTLLIAILQRLALPVGVQVTMKMLVLLFFYTNSKSCFQANDPKGALVAIVNCKADVQGWRVEPTGCKFKDFWGNIYIQSAKVSSVFLVSPVSSSLFIFSLCRAINKTLCLWFPLRLCLICSKLVLSPAGGNRHYFETIKHIYDKIIIMNTAVPILFWNIYNLFSAENTTRYCRFSRKLSVHCCICWVLILIVFNLSN